MTDEALDFLTGGSIPAAAFPEVGDVVRGTIRSYEKKQQTEFGTGKPKFFDNGDPMMQVVITLDTDLRDPENDDDDGTRKLYVKGQMRQAVGDAIRKSGHRGSLVGGKLAVKYERDGEAKRGQNPPKEYRAQFEAPSQTDEFYEDSEVPF